jgi:hypothetical protein
MRGSVQEVVKHIEGAISRYVQGKSEFVCEE